MSCFSLLCEEADIRCGQDELTINHLLPNYQIYTELGLASTVMMTGRAALQKRVMALLRRIDRCTPGCLASWEQTWQYWDSMTKLLMNAKSKIENDANSELARNIAKRRQSQQSAEHDSEDYLIEWTNMTGWLCALGGVCIQSSKYSQKAAPQPLLATSFSSFENNRKGSAVECEPINQFIEQLLKLLVWPNERYGTHIQKHVKEFVALEISPSLYPILFDQIKSSLDKFFDSQQQVIVTELNTQFILHIIFIMRQVFEIKREGSPEYLGSVTCVEAIFLLIVKYIRHIDPNYITNIQLKTKFCQLVESMMFRRDDLTFRQEMKFRNKMVEYLTDFVMNSGPAIGTDCIQFLRDLDQASMQGSVSVFVDSF